MIYFRAGLVLLYIKRIIQSMYCLALPSTNLYGSRVFFFTNGNHIQTPGLTGLIGDKYEYWLEQAEASGIMISHILNPFASIPKRKCQRRNIFIEALILFPMNLPVSRKALLVLFQSGKIKTSIRNIAIFKIYCVAIKRNNPEIILGIALPPILCLAANLYGVKTAEFQHGVGYKEEFDFQTGHEFSPDLMLMWHEIYTEVSRGYGRKSITVGFPVNEQNLPQLFNPNISSLEEAQVLFTLSYLVLDSSDEYGYVHKEIATAISEFLKVAKRVTLRLHPAIEADLELIPWRRFSYREIKNSFMRNFPGAEIEFSSSRPLAMSLRESHLHVSFKSSAIFEAAIFGVPSILMSRDRLPLLLPTEVASSELVCYSDADSIISRSQELLPNSKSGISNVIYPSVISDLLYDWESSSRH
jgi:hypothetical protein